jgi:hypothetical protein
MNPGDVGRSAFFEGPAGTYDIVADTRNAQRLEESSHPAIGSGFQIDPQIGMAAVNYTMDSQAHPTRCASFIAESIFG